MTLNLTQVDAGVIEGTKEKAIIFCFVDLAGQDHTWTLVEEDITKLYKVLEESTKAIMDIKKGKTQDARKFNLV